VKSEKEKRKNIASETKNKNRKMKYTNEKQNKITGTRAFNKAFIYVPHKVKIRTHVRVTDLVVVVSPEIKTSTNK
jgi:hypothetical protein